MKFILTILFLCISVVFPQAIDTHNSKTVYQKLLEYKKSAKHFELLLINQQLIYVSEIIELDSLELVVNILNDRRIGQFRSFESLVKQEIEDAYPKLLRNINLVNISAVNEERGTSAFNKIPYSTTTLVVIVPLLLLFVKFISTMMIG